MENVRKIEELSDYKKVNEFLEYGWVYLDCYVTTEKTADGARNDTIHFVMAWNPHPLSYEDEDLRPRYPGVDEKLKPREIAFLRNPNQNEP